MTSRLLYWVKYFKLFSQAHVDVLKLKNKEKLEEKNDLGTELFNDFTTLEAQMQSLKTKGFLRAYKSYTPPSNLKELFLSTCSSSLGRHVTESSLSTDILDNVEVKFKVLNALSQAFNHSVHNSRLTEIKTLADALLYYQVNYPLYQFNSFFLKVFFLYFSHWNIDFLHSLVRSL